MAHQNETHDSGSGFWGLANTILAIAFGGFALLSGSVLIIGGVKNSLGGKTEAPATPAAAAPATAAAFPATAPAAPTPAGGASAAAPAAAPAGASAVSGDGLVVTIKPGLANPISYDITSFTAKSGQKVKLTFANQHPTGPLQHNLILCKPGTKDAIIALSNAMMLDMAKWLPKGFIPESPDVLHHTKLLNPGESETLEFTAGPPGDYPYICTFPGHSLIMQGTMKVE